MLPGSGGLSILSTEYLTSAEVSSLPLWNLMPRFSVQRIAVLLMISNFSASAGLTFRLRSHSTRESYANSFAQWLAVRIPPNGATCAGSDSSPQMIRPPRRILGVPPSKRFGAAVAPPASEPAATAPAPTAPAFFSSSRRSSLEPAGFADVGSSDIGLRPPLPIWSSEDLTDPWCVSMNVVIKDGLTDLKVGKSLDRLRIELDPEPRRPGHFDEPVRHRERLHEDVLLLQRVVRIAGERVVGRRGDHVDVAGRRDAELGPAADRAPLAGCVRESADLVRPSEPAGLRLDQREHGAQVGARLVRGDRHRDGAAHLGEAPHVEVRHRLLDVLEVEALEAPDPLDRRRDAPDHVRVDADLHVGPDAIAD